MKVVSTDKAPAAIGPYSQGIIAGDMLFASGQIPINPATGEVEAVGIRDQATQAMKNVGEILKAAGTDFDHVVKTTCFLADIADFGAMNGVYSQFFSAPYPARSAFAVKDLPKGALVEIECIAEK